MSFEHCDELMLNRLQRVVDQVESVTMEQALDRAILLCCPDGAEHKALGETNNGIIKHKLLIALTSL